MANRVATYLSKNWKLWTNQPTSGDFVLDISKLNGTDILGTGASGNGTFSSLEALIVELSISEGAEMSNFSSTSLNAPTLNAVLSFENFSVNDLRSLVIGKRIEVTYENAQTTVDPIYGKNSVYFQGFISSVDINLVPGDLVTSVSLQAVNAFANELNKQKTLTKDTSINKGEFFSLYLGADPNYPFFFTNSIYNFANNIAETKTIGEWLSDHLGCELSVPSFYLQPFSSGAGLGYRTVCVVPGSTTANGPFAFPAINVGEDKIIGCDTQFTSADVPTSFDFTLYSNSAIRYQKSYEQLNGFLNARQLRIFATTLDVANLTQLTQIAERFISTDQPLAPTKIEVITATNNQDLEFLEQNVTISGVSTPHWLYPADLIKCGYEAITNLSSFGLDTQKQIVTGRTITITPDNWITTYNLWKGLY
jgi:hypothetical protein